MMEGIRKRQMKELDGVSLAQKGLVSNICHIDITNWLPFSLQIVNNLTPSVRHGMQSVFIFLLWPHMIYKRSHLTLRRAFTQSSAIP